MSISDAMQAGMSAKWGTGIPQFANDVVTVALEVFKRHPEENCHLFSNTDDFRTYTHREVSSSLFHSFILQRNGEKLQVGVWKSEPKYTSGHSDYWIHKAAFFEESGGIFQKQKSLLKKVQNLDLNRFFAYHYQQVFSHVSPCLRTSIVWDTKSNLAYYFEEKWGHSLNSFGYETISNLASQLLQMISIICFIHSNGYVFEDVKIPNFVSNKEGIIKIIDFEMMEPISRKTNTQVENYFAWSPAANELGLFYPETDLFGFSRCILHFLFGFRGEWQTKSGAINCFNRKFHQMQGKDREVFERLRDLWEALHDQSENFYNKYKKNEAKDFSFFSAEQVKKQIQCLVDYYAGEKTECCFCLGEPFTKFESYCEWKSLPLSTFIVMNDPMTAPSVPNDPLWVDLQRVFPEKGSKIYQIIQSLLKEPHGIHFQISDQLFEIVVEQLKRKSVIVTHLNRENEKSYLFQIQDPPQSSSSTFVQKRAASSS